MIAAGRVDVNGVTITEMGVKVKPEDDVRVDGRAVDTPKLFYVAMNKPTGYVTTLRDPQGRPTVTKLLPNLGVTLKPVGRLDMDTEGLLIFTNDGEFAHRLAHPRYQIEKEYVATVKGRPDEKAIEKLRKGVFLADEIAEQHGRPTGRKTAPAQVFLLGEAGSEQSKLKLILHEGRKRQIRLMFEAVGHTVVSLKRLRIGSLYLNKMRKGECRLLGMDEVDGLKRELAMPVER